MEYAYKNSLIVNRFVKHSYYTCISKTKFTYACIRRTSEPQDRASEPGLSSDGETPWAGRKRVCSSSIASSQDFNSVLWVSNNRIRVSTMCFSSTPIHTIHKSNWRKHVTLGLEIRTNLATRAEGQQSSKKNGVILHCLHLGTQQIAENNHELRQAQTLQVSLQLNTHKTEQPIESPSLTTDFSPQSPMSPLAACSPL